MLVLEQKSDGIALLRHRPAKPTIIAGGLFAAMAAVPALSGAEISGPRLLTTLGLAAVAGCLLWLGRPSVIRRQLPPEFQKNHLKGAVRIELGGTDSYQARLVRSDGSSLVLFERSEPAGVVNDVLAVASRFPLSVRPGWMLDDVAWAVLSQTASSARSRPGIEPIELETWPLERQRTAAYTSLWAGLFVLVVAIVMAMSPYRSGIAPSTLSVMLPLLTVVYVLAVGTWLVGLRERLTLKANAIERSRMWCGRPLGRPQRVEARVQAIFPVGPKTSSIRHVLVATDAGPLAFAVDPPAAERLAAADQQLRAAAGRAAE